MKQSFRGYYKVKKDDISKLWKECTFVFDTNTLLHFYRYSKKTSADFLKILQSIPQRIWIPYQVALEYHQHKHEMQGITNKNFDGLVDSVNKFKENLKSEIRSKVRDPYKDFDELFGNLDKSADSILKEIDTYRKYYPTEDESEKRSEEIAELFDGKVGKPYEKNEKEKLKEAEERLSNKIPPGYKDAAKESPKRLGDILVWLQILDKAVESKKPIIFITDDVKEDWWYVKDGKTIGPRPELIQEIHRVSKVGFHMYQPSEFLKHAQTELKQKVEKSSIDEAKQIEKNIEINRSIRNATAHLEPISLRAIQGSPGDFILNQGYDRNPLSTIISSSPNFDLSTAQNIFRLGALGETGLPSHVINIDPTSPVVGYPYIKQNPDLGAYFVNRPDPASTITLSKTKVNETDK